MTYKDKIKERETSRRWYAKNKGKPVEHKKVSCEICGESVTQTNTLQKTCGKKYCKKKCHNKVKKGYYDNNKEDWKKRDKVRYDKNTTNIKKRSKNHYENHKEERAKYSLDYANRRYKEDEGFRMRKKLGTALGYVIRHYIKTGKIANPMKKYCIDWKGIIKVLTPIPKPRRAYDVDHIIPLWKFDLTNWEQVRIAFAPENHRWLTKKQNQKRSKLKRERTI